MQLDVDFAQPTDAAAFLDLVDALADYEALPRPTVDARERLVRDAFGERRRFNLLLARLDKHPVGYAAFFETYSTFLALPTLYLEDLFVLSDARGCGAGGALFDRLRLEARQRGCGRMEWSCLNWNELAIGFYARRGASHLEEWRSYRLNADQLTEP